MDNSHFLSISALIVDLTLPLLATIILCSEWAFLSLSLPSHLSLLVSLSPSLSLSSLSHRPLISLFVSLSLSPLLILSSLFSFSSLSPPFHSPLARSLSCALVLILSIFFSLPRLWLDHSLKWEQWMDKEKCYTRQDAHAVQSVSSSHCLWNWL